MKRDRIEIEAVRPGQNTVVEKDAVKEQWIAKRLDHFAAFGNQVGKVTLSLRTVGENDAQAVAAVRLDPDHVDQFEHLLLRIHSTSAPGTRCKLRRSRARRQFCSRISLRSIQATPHIP